MAPRLVGQGAERQPGRQHQALLRAGHDHVDTPRVHRQIGDAEARHGVDDEDRRGRPRHRGDALHVVQHARRGLAVLHQHRTGFGMRSQGLGDAIRGHRRAEGRDERDDGEAVGRADLLPALAELARPQHEHGVAGRERADDGRLHAARARSGERNHVLGGLEQSLEPRPNLDEQRLVLRRPVVDHRLGHRQQHVRGNRGRPRRHQIVLLHHAHSLDIPRANVR